ncbi:MAG TPA: Rossmann-like and DUF2520 domain-containing protein [Gemmatimonadales bacterium]|nr:Rossmann-like and DUF2520 domain-containing protein [Gemmatimonadales bacterium]
MTAGQSARIAVVGRGRIGAGLGLVWSRAGAGVTLLVRDAGTTHGLAAAGPEAWAAAIANAECVLLATPDREIHGVARQLAELGAVHSRHVVLHTSGLLDRTALAPLAMSGAGLGSLHPLMAVARAEDAPEQVRGGFAGIEGDAPAVAAATHLATLAGMIPVPIPSSAKAAYHAAATMVSNYTVTLYDSARRLAEQHGVPSESAARIYLPLLRGTVTNLEGQEPAAALTGAIRRGDAETVAAHLRALGDADLRRLYVELGRATLQLARRAGLEEEAAERVAGVLGVER